MKNVALYTISCWLFPTLCMANGGGYAYGVNLTGTVTPFVPQGTEAIQIVDEKLDIVLTPGGAKVEVRYTLKNTADKNVAVTFGFPVERVWDPDDKSAKRPKTLPKQFRNYSVRLDGQPVKARYRIERYRKKKRKLRSIAKLLKRIEGWMVSTISFDSGQQRKMLIQYGAAYDERGETVSDDDHRAPAIFRYRLSTGAVWHGPIARGRVTVRALGVHLPWVKIKRPVNRFRKQKDTWTWSFSNLEPTLADDLEIHAVPRMDVYAVYGDDESRRSYYSWDRKRKKVYLAHFEYGVRATSKRGKSKWRYSPKNIRRSSNAWCEGVAGAGAGEALEIVPWNKKRQLFALEIVSGSTSRKQFARNNRPAALEIVLNDKHRFTAKLADDPRAHLFVVEGYRKTVKKVKIIVKKVYKGRDDHTCITHIRLVSKATPPKHYGAR